MKGGRELKFMGTKGTIEKWGYTQGAIVDWCRKGLIAKAKNDATRCLWCIPINAKCPRKKTNVEYTYIFQYPY